LLTNNNLKIDKNINFTSSDVKTG